MKTHKLLVQTTLWGHVEVFSLKLTLCKLKQISCTNILLKGSWIFRHWIPEDVSTQLIQIGYAGLHVMEHINNFLQSTTQASLTTVDHTTLWKKPAVSVYVSSLDILQQQQCVLKHANNKKSLIISRISISHDNNRSPLLTKKGQKRSTKPNIIWYLTFCS